MLTEDDRHAMRQALDDGVATAAELAEMFDISTDDVEQVRTNGQPSEPEQPQRSAVSTPGETPGASNGNGNGNGRSQPVQLALAYAPTSTNGNRSTPNAARNGNRRPPAIVVSGKNPTPTEPASELPPASAPRAENPTPNAAPRTPHPAPAAEECSGAPRADVLPTGVVSGIARLMWLLGPDVVQLGNAKTSGQPLLKVAAGTARLMWFLHWWCAGETAPRVAKRLNVGMTPKQVYRSCHSFRGLLGHDVVPVRNIRTGDQHAPFVEDPFVQLEQVITWWFEGAEANEIAARLGGDWTKQRVWRLTGWLRKIGGPGLLPRRVTTAADLDSIALRMLGREAQ